LWSDNNGGGGGGGGVVVAATSTLSRLQLFSQSFIVVGHQQTKSTNLKARDKKKEFC
jgi:hypothetical protein